MAFTAKPLAHIQLANAKGDVLAPAGKVQVHSIILHNTNTSTEAVELFYHDGTNEYKHWKVNIAQDKTVIIDFKGPGLIILGASSGKITGNTDTAAKVTCTIMGSEVT